MKQITLLLIITLLISCKKNTTKDSVIISTTKKNSPKKELKQKEIVKEKIVLDTFKYPKDKDNSTKIKVFLTGLYYENQKTAKIKNWFGFFKDSSGYYIKKTTIKTANVVHPLNEEGGKKGFMVETTNKDNCYLLISGISLPEKRVLEVKNPPKRVFPDDTVKINFLNKKYYLFATGIKKKTSQIGYYSALNYKLYLTSFDKNKSKTSLLVSDPTPESITMIPIFFMGDIDGDNKLDLIINTSYHYSYIRPTLYLSKPAKSKESVKMCGFYESDGC